MVKKTFSAWGLAAAAMLSGVSAAGATTLTGNLNVDDSFTAYLSTDDSVIGVALASGGNWQVTNSLSSLLSPGTNYFLHIAATDLYGAPSAFLGSFGLSDTGFHFSNGTQSLVSNLTDWKVSPTAFGTGYITPTSLGVNGDSPWGKQAAVDPSAQWIWTGPSGTVQQAYFSTEITAAVPEPESYAMMLAGLGLMGIVAKRRKGNQA